MMPELPSLDPALTMQKFVSRFGRLQDHLGEKLLPCMAALVGENSKTLLNALASAETLDLLTSADAFIVARKYHSKLASCTLPC